MSVERVFIGLGANLDDPARQIASALDRLDAAVGAVARCSPRYRTRPWGETDQPWFVNAVAELRTGLSPSDLLAALLALEDTYGRVRERRWGPRILDLDLLAYGQRRIEEPGLSVPHPRLAERRFVLVPWARIAPEFVVPGLGRVDALLQRCRDGSTVEVIDEEPACTKVTTPDRH